MLLCCKLIGEHTKETHRFEAAKTHYFRWFFFILLILLLPVCVCVCCPFTAQVDVFFFRLSLYNMYEGGNLDWSFRAFFSFFLSSLSLSVAFFFNKKKIKN